MKNHHKEFDDAVKMSLLEDKELHSFLEPVFSDAATRVEFIKRCLSKLDVRRMLLRAAWYVAIADDQNKIRHDRPALRLIFLLSFAEAIAKQRIGDKYMESFKAIQDFFSCISKEDRSSLEKSFKRSGFGRSHHKLRFSSLLRILYNVRNAAVHGEDYFSFSLMEKRSKEQHAHYSSFSLYTAGYLGPRNKQKRVSLDVRLTYEELREVFRRTAIANIEKSL